MTCEQNFRSRIQPTYDATTTQDIERSSTGSESFDLVTDPF